MEEDGGAGLRTRLTRGERRRVVVVGGGAAGLAAAVALHREGIPVTLVEARGRLGGRIDSQLDPVLGIAVERGAEFVHGRPPVTTALARSAGARLLEVPPRHRRRHRGRLVDVGASLSSAEELLRIGRSDDESFQTVIRRERAARALGKSAAVAEEFVRGFYLADPHDASSLALATMTRALDEIDGDVLSRVAGGYARLLDPLVRELRRAGADLRLSMVVERIHWRSGQVAIRARGPSGAPLRLRGRAALVTVPVSILRAGAIRFVPAIAEKSRAAAALTMGAIVKVVLRFRRAPWRSGASGLVFLHVPGAPVPVFWTLAPLDAPLLVGWAGGPYGTRLAGCSESEIVRTAVDSAARGLGRSRREVEEHLDGAEVIDWTRDPFARGGYAVFPVGSRGASSALARGVERTLFFAGEATAGGHAGTVNGALESGERAAREILDAR